MRNKRFNFSAFLIAVICLTGLQAQTLFVNEINGTQTAYTLSEVRKITFSSGNLSVLKTDQSSGIFALNGLISLIFKEFTSVKKELAQQPDISIAAYPNPVTDVLNIQLTGTNTDGKISILSTDGKVVMTRGTNNYDLIKLNMSQLPQGIYLFRYISSTGIQTIKIIKKEREDKK